MVKSLYERALRTLLTQDELESTTAEWFLNGERGYWHGDSRCRKLKRGTRPASKTASLAQALGRRTCHDCFGEAASGIFSSRAVARSIFATAREYECAQDIIEDARYAVDLARAYRRARVVLEDIGFVRQTLGNDALAESCLERMEEGALVIQGRAREEVVTQEGYVRSLIALSHMRPARGTSDGHGVTASEQTLLGGDTHGYSGRMLGGKSLYQMWEETMEKHLGDANRKEHIEADLAAVAEYVKSKVTLVHVSQLEGISIDTPVTQGASLTDLVANAWSGHKDFAIDSMLERWTSALTMLESRTCPRYLALVPEKLPQSDNLDLAVLSWEVTRNVNGGVLLEVPEVVAQWAVDHQQSLSLSRVSRYAQHCEAVDDPRVGETALALWEPGADGPYSTFSECVAAAKALLR